MVVSVKFVPLVLYTPKKISLGIAPSCAPHMRVMRLLFPGSSS